MADHQHAMVQAGERAELAAFRGRSRQRFLAEHIFARFQGLFHQRKMALDRRRDNNRIDVGCTEDPLGILGGFGVAKLLSRHASPLFGQIADPDDLRSCDGVKISSVIWPPLAEADQADPHFLNWS